MHHLKRYQWISAANAWTGGCFSCCLSDASSAVSQPLDRDLHSARSASVCIKHTSYPGVHPAASTKFLQLTKTFTNYNVGWGRLGLSTLVVIKRMCIWLCTLESTGKHSFGSWNNQVCRKNHDHIDQLTGWTSCSGYSCTSPAFSSRSCGSPPTQLTPKCSQEKTVTIELFTYTAFTEVHVLVIWM